MKRQSSIKPLVVLYYKQKATCPEVLYDDVIEARERVVLVQEKSELELPDDSFMVTGVTGEKVKRRKFGLKLLLMIIRVLSYLNLLWGGNVYFYLRTSGLT